MVKTKTSGTHQSHHLEGCQAMGKSSFILFFLSLAFFITFVRLNKPNIIVMVTHTFQFLFCYKPVRDKLQRGLVIFYCLITLLLRFKVIWYISQGFWFILNSFFTYPFGFKMIGDIFQLLWAYFNCFFSHLLCLRMVWYIFQGFWFIFSSFFTHPFGFKAIKDSVQRPWIFFNGFLTHFQCLKRSGTCPSVYGFLRSREP